MNFGVLFIPALGGYWLLTRTYFWRFQTRRESGYSLFFASAAAGTILLGVARLITSLAEGRCPEVEKIWATYAPFDYSGTIFVSALVALAVPPLMNRLVGEYAAAKKSAKDNGDLIEWVIQDSLDRRALVEITTKSGKSYIGFARESGITAQGETDVGLIPLASGYRRPATRELVITTRYATALRRCLDSDSPDMRFEDFQVVLPTSEIVSARLFAAGTYKLLLASSQPRRNGIDV